MKQLILFTMILIFASASFGQKTNSSKNLSRNDYIKNSRTQKIVGFILLGGGIISILSINGSKTKPGGVYDGDIKNKVIIGSTLAAASIPLFIASAKNKSKANAATTFFKMETVPVVIQHSFTMQTIPAVSIKFRL